MAYSSPYLTNVVSRESPRKVLILEGRCYVEKNNWFFGWLIWYLSYLFNFFTSLSEANANLKLSETVSGYFFCTILMLTWLPNSFVSWLLGLIYFKI